MNHRREVHRQPLESGGDPPALLQPAVALLDRAALAAGLAIEADPAIARVLVAAPEDHGPDRVAAQPLADARGAAALVAGERFRAPAAADVDAVHDRFEIRALVDLAGRDVGGEGCSVTLSNRWILLPNPPRERPRAWSSGSWEPPLSRPPRPPSKRAPTCRPRTTGPSRCGPPHRAGSGAPPAPARTPPGAARCRSACRPTPTARIARAGRATGHHCAAPKTPRSTSRAVRGEDGLWPPVAESTLR